MGRTADDRLTERDENAVKYGFNRRAKRSLDEPSDDPYDRPRVTYGMTATQKIALGLKKR